jgi:hypothetical protein
MRPSSLRALALAGLLVLSPSAVAQSPPVIAPGQEPLLADMLGKDASLPGGCAWAGATVEETRVVSWYTCAGERVELELRHPTDALAPDAAARTDRFAVRLKSSSAPPDLAAAIAVRIRAREAEFRWVGAGGAAAPLAEDQSHALRDVLAALAVAAAAGAAMILIHRRLARSAPSPARLGPRAVIAFSALAVAVAFGLAAAVHRAARAFGDAALAGLGRNPAFSASASAIAMIAYLGLALGASALIARIPSKLPSLARFAAGAAIYLAITYPPSLAREEPMSFGDIVAGRPNTTSVEARPDRPPATYRTNALGFREPGWSLDQPEGTLRVALLGDSYVFGIGVEGDETLSAALSAELSRRLPARRLEVLNLGIPGDNLGSHVDVYAAAERLSPDVAVLCLTLPNDLSRWDVQIARRESSHVSAFSFARFLLGDAAGVFWDLARLERTITPAGLSHLDREMARLASIRAAEPARPGLVFFSFRELGAAVKSRLEAVPGARVIPEGDTSPDDFLRGDGHPSPAGNRRFAERIAGAVEAELGARRQAP